MRLSSVKPTTAILFGIAALASANGGRPPPYIKTHPGALRLMERRTIRLQTAGEIELDYDRGLNLLSRSTLLEDIQAAYTDGLPAGETAEFVVRQTEPGHYSFVNRHRQHCRIEEVFRARTPENRFVLVLFVQGERWFGAFQSLIQIEVRPGVEDEGCRFRVDVDAFPHHAFLRSVVRLRPIKRFFEQKMNEIVAIGMQVIESLDRHPANPEPTMSIQPL